MKLSEGYGNGRNMEAVVLPIASASKLHIGNLKGGENFPNSSLTQFNCILCVKKVSDELIASSNTLFTMVFNFLHVFQSFPICFGESESAFSFCASTKKRLFSPLPLPQSW